MGRCAGVQDLDLHRPLAETLYAETSLDLRGVDFTPYYIGDLTGASSIEYDDGKLAINHLHPGQGDRTVQKT